MASRVHIGARDLGRPRTKGAKTLHLAGAPALDSAEAETRTRSSGRTLKLGFQRTQQQIEIEGLLEDPLEAELVVVDGGV